MLHYATLHYIMFHYVITLYYLWQIQSQRKSGEKKKNYHQNILMTFCYLQHTNKKQKGKA